MPASRKLTPAEITQLAETVFGTTIDYSLVRLRQGGPLTWTGCFVVINSTIHIPYSCWSGNYGLQPLPPVLFHEAGHVWQFHNRTRPELKNYWWGLAALEHLQFRNPYSYHPTQGSALTDYRFEQQGQIIQDYIQLGKPPILKSILSRSLPLGL
jgi:hypothetical protein